MSAITSPARRRVMWVEKEIHSEVTKYAPVMETILENVGVRHSISRESVYKEGFKFTFYIMD